MMTTKMMVQVISKETIKPSSPTPPHLTSFKLSYFDQLALSNFVGIILFYTSNDGNTECRSREQNSNHLKESLSKCLTSLYPLAGRIKENCSEIDCNDAGVEFWEARVINSNLSDVMINRNQDCTPLNQFLPYLFGTPMTCNTPLLAIQVNAFDCGGMAIGISISHKVADASSISTFLKAWSTVATNSTIIKPCFDLASLFPMKEYLAGSLDNYEITTQEKIVTKRFVFDSSSISSIKQEMLLATIENSSASSFTPTRVETVLSFIIKRLAHLNRANKIGCQDKPITMLCIVNLRKRRVPPVPDETFGNMISAVVVPIISDAMDNNINGNSVDRKNTSHTIDMATLAAKIRAAVRAINHEYLEKLENDGDWYVTLSKSLLEETGFLVVCSSWCRFGFYEIADFGWGKPIWFSIGTMNVKNTILLTDTRSGDGIEAWVNMVEEDMVKFERDQELLACVSSSE